jgi:hypothetical protein
MAKPAENQGRQQSQRNGQPDNGRPEHFERFEDLAKKLVQVPKKELDALRKKKR